MTTAQSDPFRLSVIVPCFNEEAGIDETHRRLTAALAAITPDYELIYVDDGSRDGTAQRLARIRAQSKQTKVLRLSRNFGHQIAVTAGLDHATGAAVVLIDADLQDPPEVIAEMVAKWREGWHVVYGKRRSRSGETRFKLITASLFYRLMNSFSEIPIPRDTGDFRLMDRRVVEALKRMPERHRLMRAMTSWVGFRQTAVEYDRAARTAGETHYPLRRMIALALDGIVSFSVAPLKALLVVGFVFCLLSLTGVGYALILRLFTDIWVSGWTLMFITNMLFGGIGLLGLGIIGEYVGRIYSEVKGRPLYLLLEVLDDDQADD